MSDFDASDLTQAPGSPQIELEDLSLCYRLAKQKHNSFKDFAVHWVSGALSYEQLWALTDLTLTIRQGESVGIVGANGAGKSSLLKVISGILKPTRGRAEVRGTIAPILELGTGFDHELTGLENIYLNALLLGHTRREIDEKRDAIIDFSGLGEFIHSPIRNYSTGMLARLGFSVATAWLPDLLIVDEVLAVGDSAFVRKCEQRLAEFHDAGSTLLLVSHIPEAIRHSCRRAFWLDHGRLAADGPAGEVLERYEEALAREPAARV